MFVASREDRRPDLQCMGENKEQFFAKFLNVMKILFFILTRQFQRYQKPYMCFYKKPIFNIYILMLTVSRLAGIPQAEFTMHRWKIKKKFCKVSQCYEYIVFYIDETIRSIPNTIYLFLKKKTNNDFQHFYFLKCLLFVAFLLTGISQARFTMYSWCI